MYKRAFIIFSISAIFLAISCKNEPKTVLPYDEEKIIRILGDMHFAKSAAKIQRVEVRDSMQLIYESQVYDINGITKEEYLNLVFVLESDLDLYYDIEKKVHQYLKTVQNEKS